MGRSGFRGVAQTVQGIWRQYGGDRRLWSGIEPIRATGTNLSDLTYGDYDFANGHIYDTRSGESIQEIAPGSYVTVEQLTGGAVRLYAEIPLSDINNPRLPGSQSVITFSHSVLDREGNQYTFNPVAISATATDMQVFVRQEGEKLLYRDVLVGQAGNDARQQAILEGFHVATPTEVQERAIKAYISKRESEQIRDLLRVGYVTADGRLIQGADSDEKYYELINELTKDAEVDDTAAVRYTLGTF